MARAFQPPDGVGAQGAWRERLLLRLAGHALLREGHL
jgi:hypothetical protein